MEPRGDTGAPNCGVPACGGAHGGSLRTGVGDGAGSNGDLQRVGADAQADILLHGAEAADVGGDGVLLAAWWLTGCGDRSEEDGG